MFPACPDIAARCPYHWFHWTAQSCWLTSAPAAINSESIRERMEAAKIYFIVFGALTIIGGIVGYLKAGSVASIIAGSITGVLLLVAAFLLPEHRTIGLATALIVSLLLAAQFVPKFLRTGRVMPAGMMSILSAIGIIAVIVAWVKK